MSYNYPIVFGYYRKVYLNLVKQEFSFSRVDDNYFGIIRQCSMKKTPEFNFPAIITNTIIEFSTKPKSNEIENILLSLEGLNCKHIVILINFEVDLQILDELFNCIQIRTICEFTLIADYSSVLYTDCFVEKLHLTNRFNNLYFFKAPFNKLLEDFIYCWIQVINATSWLNNNLSITNIGFS